MAGEPKNTIILFNPRNMRGIGDDFIPPIALLMISVHLHEKYDIVIIDQRIHKDWKQRLLNAFGKKPVCIGVTALTGKQIKQGLYASKIAKNRCCPVVWGGIHASLLPEQTIKHPLVDYVIQGEGEESFREIVEAIAEGRPCKKILGVWSKKNGEISFGGRRPFVDLNKLPPIPYHLCDLEKYIKPGPHGNSIGLYTSKGCPQRCEFCYNFSYNESRWRAFSSNRILGDINNLKDRHPDIEHFQFWDDNFFANLERSREIAEGLKRLGPSITWSSLGGHIRDIYRMDDDYLKCLKESGFKTFLVGVESGSQKIIDSIHKNFKIEELFIVNRRLGHYGIAPNYSFISGVIGEDDEDIKKTIEAMFRLKKENPDIVFGTIKPLMCYPGTGVYKKALEMGFKPPEYLEGWINFSWGNYLNLKIPWVSARRKRFLSWLYYYSLLISPGYIFINSKLFDIAANFFRPVAEWRLKKFYFRFPVEAWSLYIAQRMFL